MKKKKKLNKLINKKITIKITFFIKGWKHTTIKEHKTKQKHHCKTIRFLFS